MRHFFLPVEVSSLVFSELSPLEILQKCLLVSKEFREQALSALFSRFDNHARCRQQSFLAAWRAHPDCFQWIKSSEKMAGALQKTFKEPLVDVNTRLSLLECQIALKDLGSVYHCADYLDLEDKECRLLTRHFVSEDKFQCLEAYYKVAQKAPYLPMHHVRSLITGVRSALEREYSPSISLRSAFSTLFKRLTRLEQIQELERLLALIEDKQQPSRIRRMSCDIMASLIPNIHDEARQHTIEQIRACLYDDTVEEVRTASGNAFLAIMPSLSQAEQITCLAEFLVLLDSIDWRERLQGSDIITSLAPSLCQDALDMVLPKIQERLQHEQDPTALRAVQNAYLSLLHKQSRTEQEKAIHTLLAWLDHDCHSSLQEMICETLSKLIFGWSLDAALPVMTKLHTLAHYDSNERVRNAAQKALAALIANISPTQQVRYLTVLADTLGSRRAHIRQRAYKAIASFAAGLFRESVQMLITQIRQPLFTEVAYPALMASVEAFLALLKALPQVERVTYLGDLLQLLSNKFELVRHHACAAITLFGDNLSPEQQQTVLSEVIKLSNNPDGVSEAAGGVFAKIFMQLSTEEKADKLALVRSLFEGCSQTQVFGITAFCKIAPSLGWQDIQASLAGLLQGFQKKETCFSVALAIKTFLKKLPQKTSNAEVYKMLQDALAVLLVSKHDFIRQAALEAATYPGMLEFWTEDTMPKIDCLEIIYLQKMQHLQQKLSIIEAYGLVIDASFNLRF